MSIVCATMDLINTREGSIMEEKKPNHKHLKGDGRQYPKCVICGKKHKPDDYEACPVARIILKDTWGESKKAMKAIRDISDRSARS